MKRGVIAGRETSRLSGDRRTFIVMKIREYNVDKTLSVGADSMGLPRRYDMSKASEVGMEASYGKANPCNHYSNNLQAFPDMLMKTALTTMIFLSIWLFY